MNGQTGSGTVFKPLSDSSFDICEKVYVDPHVCFLLSVNKYHEAKTDDPCLLFLKRRGERV